MMSMSGCLSNPFFFSSRRRHTRCLSDWSSDVCSKDVIRSLFGDAIANLRYYRCVEAAVEGIPVVVSRTGWTGEVGYEIYLRDGSRGDDLWRRVEEAGEPFGIRAIAPSEARRIEAGIFSYGSGIRPEDPPCPVTGLARSGALG